MSLSCSKYLLPVANKASTAFFHLSINTRIFVKIINIRIRTHTSRLILVCLASLNTKMYFVLSRKYIFATYIYSNMNNLLLSSV